MCGRFVSKVTAALLEQWGLSEPPADFESYNVAPSQLVPVVRAHDGERTCELLRWGLIPFFAKGVPGKYSTINARIETIETLSLIHI